jgi:hypothetical protein
MDLADLIATIEGHGFSAEVNLAAGATAFRRTLRGHHLVVNLTELAAEPRVRAILSSRIVDLSAREIDPRYENIYDAALCAYLTVLDETADPDLVLTAARVALKARNCWWTVELSEELLTRAVAGTITSVLNMLPQRVENKLKEWDATGVLVGAPRSAIRGALQTMEQQRSGLSGFNSGAFASLVGVGFRSDLTLLTQKKEQTAGKALGSIVESLTRPRRPPASEGDLILSQLTGNQSGVR